MDHGVFEASDSSTSNPARRGFLQRVRDVIGHLQALELEALPGLIAKFEASQRSVEATLNLPRPAALELISPLELKTVGRYQLENRCRALANPVYLGDHTALCRILGCYKLYVDTTDTGFGSHVLLEGYWEMWLTIFFAKHLQPGMTVIDVGANFGYYSVLFGALVEDTGHVYAVEPNPAVAARLRRSIDLNGFAPRTTIVEAAAGAVHGAEVTLYAPRGEPKNATVVSSSDIVSPELGTTYKVPQVRLDEVASGSPRIDFVKIDAEGAEEGVIAGMMGILKRDRPGLILEFNAARYRDPGGFLDELQAIYSRMRYIDYSGDAVSIAASQVVSERWGEDWLLYFDQFSPSVELETLREPSVAGSSAKRGPSVHLEIPGLPQKVLLNPPAGDFLALEKLGGRFFSEILRLPAGSYAAKVQIMFSEAAAGENVRVAARLLSDRAELDSLELTATPENRTKLDDLLLRFRLEEEQSVEIFGTTEANCTTTLIRYITVVSQSDRDVNFADFNFQGYTLPSVKDLTCVIFGTTAICNASCPHCPTNKVHRRDFPHGSMNFDMFTRIVTELRDEGYPGWFLFGLFGEPLEDPLLEKRLRLIKELLPRATISIATNCGVYDPKKHACIVELADHIGVHVEGVSSEVYNRFMHPLKAERVFPKIISLLSIDQGKKVHITTPVHKGNLAEVANIRKYFEGYGAGEPHFTQIGNRSWEEGPWSQLALAPVGRWCAPDELRTFVVDWDGAVLACCLDFSKSAKLGDLTKQSIRGVLGSKPWLDMFDIHRTKSWSQKEACSRCRGDLYGNTQTIVQPLLGVGDQAQHLSGHAFNVVPGVTRDEAGSICVGKKTADGIVIYGPYRRLDPGRYRVRHFLEVIKIRARKASIETDIVVDGARRIAIKHYPISRQGGLELDLDFESDGSVTEFRVAKVGVEFVHNGAIVEEI